MDEAEGLAVLGNWEGHRRDEGVADLPITVVFREPEQPSRILHDDRRAVDGDFSERRENIDGRIATGIAVHLIEHLMKPETDLDVVAWQQEPEGVRLPSAREQRGGHRRIVSRRARCICNRRSLWAALRSHRERIGQHECVRHSAKLHQERCPLRRLNPGERRQCHRPAPLIRAGPREPLRLPGEERERAANGVRDS